jgi:hypothetical protein
MVSQSRPILLPEGRSALFAIDAGIAVRRLANIFCEQTEFARK